MYRIATYGPGIIYTTRDNWNAIDSTAPIIADSVRARQDVFVNCSFGVGDNIFAYGDRITSHGVFPCVAQTTNGGQQWNFVLDDSSSFWNAGWIHALSDVDRDTIIAGLTGNLGNQVLWSTNHGETWRVDTLIVDDPGIQDNTNGGVGLNSQGELVAAFSDVCSPALLIGKHVTAGVSINSAASTMILGLS